jgi:hypothetical protein
MSEKIEVYDSFLKKQDLKNIQNFLLSDNFPWYFYDRVNGPQSKIESREDEKYNFHFSHTFYYQHRPTSEYIEILNPILEKLDMSAILRIKANLVPVANKKVSFGFHVDEKKFFGKTGIFYVNTNNGSTVFKSGEEVESVENRYVLFNSQIPHSGTTCTDKKYRVLINFNYYTW